MNKRSKLLALLLTLAVTVAVSLLPPQVSAQNCTCLQHVRRTTSAACSTGSCYESENCLIGALSGQINCEYGTCYENLVITQSCFQPAPGSYQVNGYIEYQCVYCF